MGNRAYDVISRYGRKESVNMNKTYNNMKTRVLGTAALLMIGTVSLIAERSKALAHNRMLAKHTG